MKLSITKLGGAILLSATLSGTALAQNLTAVPSTQQIQNLTHTAEKLAIVGAGVGLGATVIGLALHHRHHSARASNPADSQALAAAYARAQQEAAMSSPKTTAETAPPAPVKTDDDDKGVKLSAASLVQPQAGLWTWQQVVGASR